VKARHVTCDYCGGRAALLKGRDIYPHRGDLCDKPFYACRPCGAWVGCHPGTTKPLGRLADQHLRKAKMRVHALLDPLWRSGQIKRSSVYARLADHMGIPPKECHVGMFSLERCALAESVLRSWGGLVPQRIIA
jgi:hypothetical protein